MLEHWVAVGRPPSVIGDWEARVEQHGLIEIRSHFNMRAPISLDIPHRCDNIALQETALQWHMRQLGIQALINAPRILMLRLTRFTELNGRIVKNMAPVSDWWIAALSMTLMLPNRVMLCSCAELMLHLNSEGRHWGYEGGPARSRRRRAVPKNALSDPINLAEIDILCLAV